jgi:CBS-domain-containing membrane protein
MRARDIMTSPVITVRAGTTVQDAAALLAARGFTALPVLDDDDRLIGIVTEADLLRGRPGHRGAGHAQQHSVGAQRNFHDRGAGLRHAGGRARCRGVAALGLRR